MAFTDKPESANEAQDHSQPLDGGGFFSLSDVIMAGRHQLTRSEHLLAADTRRNARNLLASAMRGSTPCFPLWALPPLGCTKTTALPPNAETT